MSRASNYVTNDCTEDIQAGQERNNMIVSSSEAGMMITLHNIVMRGS